MQENEIIIETDTRKDKSLNEDELSNLQRLKQKLAAICHTRQFCGVCLDRGGSEKLWSVNTEFDIAVEQQSHKKLLKDIIDYILNNEVSYQIRQFFLNNLITLGNDLE